MKLQFLQRMIECSKNDEKLYIIVGDLNVISNRFSSGKLYVYILYHPFSPVKAGYIQPGVRYLQDISQGLFAQLGVFT